MREIYLWTDWFEELAKKIAADNGKNFLMERAGRVENLRYGDLNVDPFSFVYNIAKQGSDPERRRQVYPGVHRAFGMENSVPVDCDDAFMFPPYIFTDTVEVFSARLANDSELLWRLFRAAVHESGEMDQYFDDALAIGGVTTEKLTQALFLINPSVFLPYDGTTRSLGIFNLPGNINWTQYQEGLQKFRDTFPGCAFYEISLFAYLWNSGELPIRDRYFQVSTNAWGEGEGDFWQDVDPNLNFEPNNWVFTGGPKSRKDWTYKPKKGDGSYPLRDPVPGDVILVRTGSQGRGIGIVYKNDYQNRLAEDSRIHVVWVNKADRALRMRGRGLLRGFSYAWESTKRSFKEA